MQRLRKGKGGSRGPERGEGLSLFPLFFLTVVVVTVVGAHAFGGNEPHTLVPFLIQVSALAHGGPSLSQFTHINSRLR